MEKTIEAQLAELRKEYKRHTLTRAGASQDPFTQFEIWLHEAISAKLHQPDAMTLATVTAQKTPDLRTVLLKSVSPEGFVFYTNYLSAKGRQMSLNDFASLLFYWPELERQVRIKGTVSRVADEVSDAYFETRPVGAQLAASISPQSEVVESREWLEAKLKSAEATKDSLKRPPHWGGYVVKPHEFEFWQGRENRLHDRLRYRKGSDGWLVVRLAP